MTQRFERLAILGLGLLGGSVALAAKRAGLAAHVVASGRRQAPLRAALEAGVIDEIAPVAEAVRNADLVVLASPIGAMESLLRTAAPSLCEGALVTDVGSVKGLLADRLPGTLPPGVHYVGAHPMAGSHRRGIDHARADLFDDACCVVTPVPDSDPAAVERVAEFWRGLGARITLRDPAEHDVDIAWVSHLPHVLAFAFAHAFGQAPDRAAETAGSGFRDFTRIARSDGELWGEIFNSNKKAITGPLEDFGQSLRALARAIDCEDLEAQEQFFALAHRAISKVSPGTDEGSEA